MTTGVKVGIAVGIAGAAILAFAAGWFASRKRLGKGSSAAAGPVPSGMNKEMRVLPGEYTNGIRGQDMMATPPYAASASTFAGHEYGGGDGRLANPPAELDARFAQRSELR